MAKTKKKTKAVKKREVKKTTIKRAAKKSAPGKKSVRKKIATKKSAKKKTVAKKPVKKKAVKKALGNKKVVSKKKVMVKKKAATKKKPVVKKKVVARKVNLKQKAVSKKAKSPKTSTGAKLNKKSIKTEVTGSSSAVTEKPRYVSPPTSMIDVPMITPPASLEPSEGAGAFGYPPYQPKPGEEYMSDGQKEHFRKILRKWREQLMTEVDSTVGHMKEDANSYPDPLDRASQEEGFNLELRTRDRERKLIKKIEQALDSIGSGDYGYCEACGTEIGIRRLEARPTADKCIDCKTFEEIRERQEGV